MPIRSPHRDALRLLFILVSGCKSARDPATGSTTGIFVGEKRLHALDFWVRNPDYLAEELLTLYQQTANRDFLLQAEEIFALDEPDIRRFPMIRYRFGAYERLDDTLSLLKSRDLVNVRGITEGGKVAEWQFLISPRAFALADEIVQDYPALGWYARRASLVVKVAGDRSGNALKDRQYEQADYADTALGGVIPAITARVRARILDLKTAEKGGEHA